VPSFRSRTFTLRVVRYILFLNACTRHHKPDRREGRDGLGDVKVPVAFLEGDPLITLDLLCGDDVLVRFDIIEGLGEMSTMVSSSERALSRCLPFREDNEGRRTSVNVEEFSDWVEAF